MCLSCTMESYNNQYPGTRIFLLILLSLYTYVIAFCPDFCECDTWYDLKRATCVGCHLYDVHTDVPNYIQALDLSNNSISRLNDLEFTVSWIFGIFKFITIFKGNLVISFWFSDHRFKQIEIFKFIRKPNQRYRIGSF